MVLSPGAAFPYLAEKENHRLTGGSQQEKDRPSQSRGHLSPPRTVHPGPRSLLHGVQASIHGSRPGCEVSLSLEGLGSCSQEQAVELGAQDTKPPGTLFVPTALPLGCHHSPPQRSHPSSPAAGRTGWTAGVQGWQVADPAPANPGWLQAEGTGT